MWPSMNTRKSSLFNEKKKIPCIVVQSAIRKEWLWLLLSWVTSSMSSTTYRWRPLKLPEMNLLRDLTNSSSFLSVDRSTVSASTTPRSSSRSPLGTRETRTRGPSSLETLRVAILFHVFSALGTWFRSRTIGQGSNRTVSRKGHPYYCGLGSTPVEKGRRDWSPGG